MRNFRKLIMLFMMVVMFFLSSCSKKEITVKDGGSPITIEMSLSSGINVSEVTRASSDFTPTVPDKYKAYFVASENTESYKAGDIVRIVDVSLGSNKIKIPDLKYNIYISNYNLKTISKESDLKTMLSSLPPSSTSLYLVKEDDNVMFHATKTIQEKLINNYAAVCVAANNFVTGATYDISPSENETNIYKLNGNWYYLYIKACAPNSMTSSTVWLKNIPYNTGSYKLDKPIEPNYIYEFTVTDNTNVGFTVNVDPFTGIVASDIDI